MTADEIMQMVDDAIDPGKMSAADAIEFLDELAYDLGTKAEALRADQEAGRV
jgi:polyhydroxyalkanoate synthesis regulator phasin